MIVKAGIHSLLLALASLLASGVQAASVSGAGASFVYPAMTKWSADYQKATANRVNYQSIGSGGGIAQVKAGTVDFGSSDAPLPPDELAKFQLAQFPSVIGGVVPVVNLAGIESGKLKLTGRLLAAIYLGHVANWNDPAISEINPGLSLPNQPIRVIYRSDGSGTTFNFVNYLSKVSPEWKQSVGEGTTVRWPGGFGGKGNEGVAAYVKQVAGSIGYVELSYATSNQLTAVAMQNAAGVFVQPTDASFQSAASSANWKDAKDFYLIITNAPAADAWPIAATNFILMPLAPKKSEGAKEALNFFRWVYKDGDAAASKLGYVPLPDALVAQIEAYWASRLKH
ncbi:MAG: phosphate ABC transporter substrate-binding protein PstS [Lysobacterales bacterium CG02_land_8_20_14_3_00_62_12]|nr:MAG: phosphate ABC transporter substrate-binding protein PstS [Xanthomonadales bacterium CG02_land_8_20_14_3_00_62_12]